MGEDEGPRCSAAPRSAPPPPTAFACPQLLPVTIINCILSSGIHRRHTHGRTESLGRLS